MNDGLEQPSDLSRSRSASVWSSTRKELLDWLQVNAPSLAEAYEGAVELLGRPGFPARLHFVAHAVRGIYNRLSDILVVVERRRVDYYKEVESIAKVWPKFTLVPPSQYSGDDTPSDADARVLVPKVAVLAVEGVLRKHELRQTSRDITHEMFAIVAETAQPERQLLETIVVKFHEVYEWFMERAHFRLEPVSDVGEEQLVQRFEQFERILLNLVRDFFKTADELDELLQEANARTD